MELWIAGKERVRLGPQEFVGQGGEAAVYARREIAFKVYADPRRALPEARIRELAVLTSPCFIKPEKLLLDAQGRPAGYTMRRVRDGFTLCQLFNRAFRERHGVTPEAMLRLVRKLRDGVGHVHQCGLLIVDLNEMNFLLDRALREIFFIDVDSYQTPSFPATALMDSVRDRHAVRFSRETDWFSFGIISFQMFTGIHPYRGRHPTLPDLETRMRANVSVLNPQVTIPRACYPLHVIPPAYQEWYRAIFEEGKRLPPPDELRPVITMAPAPCPISGSDQLLIRELHRFPAEIIFPIPSAGPEVALTTRGLYLAGRRYDLGPEVRIGITPQQEHRVAAWVEGRELQLYDLTAGQPGRDRLEAEALTEYEGRIYVKKGAALYELQLLELPAGLRAALKPVGNVMEQATRLFDGVAMQSMLGACYASLFPRPGSCGSLRLPELDRYQVVDARFDAGVLMVIGFREGRYDQFIFRLDEPYRSYDLRIIPDFPAAGLNFVTLPTGVCLHLNADEELELFSARKGSPELKRIADPALHGARLFRDGAGLLFARGDRLYSATLKAA